MKLSVAAAILSLLLIGEAKGQTWSKLVPASPTAPSPRYNASGVYDEIDNTLVIFGGRNTGGPLNDIWSFNLDLLTWTNITPADTNQPARRFAHNAVYDPPSRRMFIWSGQGVGFYNDVWAFDLASHTWQKMMPGGTLPNSRYGSASVYDPVGRRLVMFAGFTDMGRYNDTRAYDISSNAWIDLTPAGTSPEVRCLHTASYDALRQRLIMYAGQHSGPLDDIWGFDLSSKAWTNLTPSVRPQGRFFSSSVYANDKVIIFGGQTSNGSVNELWTFNLADTTWTMMNPLGTTPGRRNSQSAIGIPQQHAMIIFGGIGDSTYNDIWKLSDIPTDVRDQNTTPATFTLHQNYPNPFNPVTEIRYDLPIRGDVRLEVFNVLGQKIQTLVSGNQEAGAHTVEFLSNGLPSGVYFYRLQAGRYAATRMSLLLK